MFFKNIIKHFHFIRIKKQFGYLGNDCSIGSEVEFIGQENIYIGNSFKCGHHCSFQTWQQYKEFVSKKRPKLIIGNSCHFMSNCLVSCLDSISIGDGCLFGDNVFVSDNYHGNNTYSQLSIRPDLRQLYSKGPVRIGDNCWIGRNVCIMPGVEIGCGVTVGANSVVTHSFPDNCIIAGTPARIIKNITTDSV